MNKKRKLVLLRLLAALVTVTSIYVFAPWEYALHYLSPLPVSVQEQLDDAVDDGVTGVIVYVDKGANGSEVFTSGLHNRQNRQPANPNALFKIASIGKLYDAAGVIKLVGRGRLNLDKTLVNYLPEVSARIEYSDQITLRMMLNHTSGIPNFTDQDNYSWGDPDPDVISLMLDKPALFIPGEDYSYSNSNYVLLQMIMTEVLGYSYWDFIVSEMLQPLGLKNTYRSINEKDINLEDVMSGYYHGYSDDLKMLDQGYIASAHDVAKFVRALNDGSFFSEKEQALYSSVYQLGHDGWVLGYLSMAHYHKDIDSVVVQFINNNGNDNVLLSKISYSRVIDILRERVN